MLLIDGRVAAFLFLPNCEVAVVWAFAQLAGSTEAPASAAASAFACTARLSWYQMPDVDRQRAHPQQHEHEDDDQHDRLTVLVVCDAEMSLL